MALARGERQGSFDDAALLLGEQLAGRSVYWLLADHGDALFGDGYFADLFRRSPLGRPTVPASRLHGSLGLVTPVEYEQARYAAHEPVGSIT